jgi:hypothetical protein
MKDLLQESAGNPHEIAHQCYAREKGEKNHDHFVVTDIH